MQRQMISYLPTITLKLNCWSHQQKKHPVKSKKTRQSFFKKNIFLSIGWEVAFL
jgi:hypothetical protein